jgi:prepilin-type N-terminal cleavage/methylation domain-containing protein
MRAVRQHGFTLVEMLVALMIAAIFFSILTGVILATFETLRSGDERTVAQENARVALNYIANDIRHATEIAPLRLEAYKDWATGGFPVDEHVTDPFFSADAWPIYRESVDGNQVPNHGFIDLDIDGGPGEGDEYDYFRKDGMPYDVRALAPNRISLTFFGSDYFPNTQYYYQSGGLPVDLDFNGASVANPTSGQVRVTYEHQLVAPFHPDIYANDFSGREKQFDMVVNRSNANAISDKLDFVVVRSFEMRNPTMSIPDIGDTATGSNLGPLATAVNNRMWIDEPYLRQPVADHVVNLRFRYWYIKGNEMLEIRYDPDTSDIGGSNGISPNDGYYRYYDQYGQEKYVWNNLDAGDDVPLLKTVFTQADWDAIPRNSFIIDGGVDGTDEYQRGLLLFEGWRFVNAVSITVKTANNRSLDIYRSTINQNVTSQGSASYDPTNPDYGMGFIDFGVGNRFTSAAATLNAYEPLYQGADNVRVSTTTVNGIQKLFDFVEPNMNPNYDASAFTTLQTFVVPPALIDRAERAKQSLRFGLGHKD